MRTTVIFDLDGVLVDSRAVFISCVNHAFVKLGLPTRADAELEPYIGPPFPYAFGELLGVAHDAPIVTACIEGYRERYKTASLTETTVAPGIPEALDALAGRRLAVATSKPKAFADPLLDAMGIGAYFSVVAGPDLAAPTEDKTETLGRALHELGPTRAVMVGDRSFDIVAAHAHGLPAIGVTWGIGTHKELHDAGAERIIGQPEDLAATAAVLLGD
ncbi:HAD hydrolase-like protein [Solirubrobacter ginsenosidimutans]|uniref:HAD hydrolase-like protein n=1 Tax=Solirubrobacter ginsenosidimutans TaxID=490573 RepID=A0A9X3MZG3_9ACTN|nr:HAD hydrolase-like protein [Solirubrobacter ginsenosidimutans]MDA0164501.1 HAD hydrolase-like protein [Solirubrobacter ginsenosidimutans]